jgi:hypothetical protein
VSGEPLRGSVCPQSELRLDDRQQGYLPVFRPLAKNTDRIELLDERFGNNLHLKVVGSIAGKPRE